MIVYLMEFGLAYLGVRIGMSFLKISSKRPYVITAVVILQVIGAVMTIFGLVSSLAKTASIGNPMHIVDFFLTTPWIIGLWSMKKWGLWGLIISTVIFQIIFVINHQWGMIALLPFVEIALCLPYYSKMR